MVVIETVRGVTTRVRFLPLILTSLGSKRRTPFYLIWLKRVNTILTLGHEFAFARATCFDEQPQHAPTRGTVEHAASSRRFPATTDYLHLVADHQEFPVLRNSRAAAEAWGAALPMAPTWVLASVAAWPLPMLLRLQLALQLQSA